MSKNHGLNSSDHAFHEIADGQDKKVNPEPTAKEVQPVAPEKVIPLNAMKTPAMMILMSSMVNYRTFQKMMFISVL